MRIWHDNSGRDDYASWFLSAMIIVDIQTGERTEFLLNRWLANEKEDGAVSLMKTKFFYKKSISLLLYL